MFPYNLIFCYFPWPSWTIGGPRVVYCLLRLVFTTYYILIYVHLQLKQSINEVTIYQPSSSYTQRQINIPYFYKQFIKGKGRSNGRNEREIKFSSKYMHFTADIRFLSSHVDLYTLDRLQQPLHYTHDKPSFVNHIFHNTVRLTYYNRLALKNSSIPSDASHAFSTARPLFAGSCRVQLSNRS